MTRTYWPMVGCAGVKAVTNFPIASPAPRAARTVFAAPGTHHLRRISERGVPWQGLKRDSTSCAMYGLDYGNASRKFPLVRWGSRVRIPVVRSRLTRGNGIATRVRSGATPASSLPHSLLRLRGARGRSLLLSLDRVPRSCYWRPCASEANGSESGTRVTASPIWRARAAAASGLASRLISCPFDSTDVLARSQ